MPAAARHLPGAMTCRPRTSSHVAPITPSPCGFVAQRFREQARPQPDELQRRKTLSQNRTGVLQEELVERADLSDRDRNRRPDVDR